MDKSSIEISMTRILEEVWRGLREDVEACTRIAVTCGPQGRTHSYAKRTLHDVYLSVYRTWPMIL
jgi:hypothetical protein